MASSDFVDRPKITPIHYSYHEPKRGLWVLNETILPVPWAEISDRQIVHFAPKAYGGNHSHPRREWFVAIGDLLFVWLDEHGVRHEEPMQTKQGLLLFEIPANLPHVVYNRSTTNNAVLWEFADGLLVNEKEYSII